MSWFDRRQVLILPAALAGTALLGGCFRPMLAEGGPSAALLGQIEYPQFNDRFGYYLNESLRDRLGTTRQAAYRLSITTATAKQDLAIAQDNSVTRISLTSTADWALYRKGEEGGAAVLSGRAVSQSGYNSTASLFATREAKLDIERRLARDLGERIARTVLARAGTLATAGAAAAQPSS
ncbi:MAG TPA: LPS assembly lipoprotein LptE [Thermohalobaculum sp.]|nr:LPS assembly lipoprotein LptE [Thermohalobaculum sp.]